jgi:hypothetical protein
MGESTAGSHWISAAEFPRARGVTDNHGIDIASWTDTWGG